MSDKPQLDPKLTPVLEPNFDRHNIEVPAWMNELWKEGARASVLIKTERRMEKSGSGSGFFVDKEGYIATANHVVDKTTGIKVITFDGQVIPAEVVSTSPRDDLAIIRLRSRTTPESCRALPIGETNALSAEQKLFNIGHPRGTALPHISVGLLERKRWDLESSVPSVTGNSGGSILDADGKVVAVSLGARYYVGKTNTPRGLWVAEKPAGEPASYSKDTMTYSAPAEALSLLLAKTDPKFSVERYTPGWAGEHLNWVKESPLHLTVDAVGLGATAYGGERLLSKYRGVAMGTGIGSGGLLALDGYRLYNAPRNESLQRVSAVAADAT
ncbi:MAG: serine protease, partial [Candidatus Obscuribacterales bacterium]|nr:serine protease [Candidatus Obscuribacterales bacterium]